MPWPVAASEVSKPGIWEYRLDCALKNPGPFSLNTYDIDWSESGFMLAGVNVRFNIQQLESNFPSLCALKEELQCLQNQKNLK
jgi:hypothetical protein